MSRKREAIFMGIGILAGLALSGPAAQAAAQGHTQAQILLERQDSSSLPSAILAVNNLLHQMGRIFQDNAWPKDGTHGQHTDRKLRRKIQQKRIAMGHKPDDHEEQTYIGPAM